MALCIETFNNTKGGQSLFKALGHPLIKPKMMDFLDHLKTYQRLAIYDPDGFGDSLAALYDLSDLQICGYYGQKYEHKGKQVLGLTTQLITDLADCDGLLILSFEPKVKLLEIATLLPVGCSVHSLEEVRLPEEMLTVSKKYLDPLNFATNYAFFRDEGALHTRLVTTNYWSLYSGRPAGLWCCLLDAEGAVLAEWSQDLGPAQSTLVIDSRDVKKKFGLSDFCGQLFLQVVGAAGHDIVKYALDIFSDDHETLSCTHDANAWPADFYAGLPAPAAEEQVILWIQNSHPCAIPAGEIGLNVMGERAVVWWPESVPAYGTRGLDVSLLLPDVRWPTQLEITAGKYFVRPRYEIVQRSAISMAKASSKRSMAHVNVQRTDLQPDPALPHLSSDFGKGFLLVAPILPLSHWQSLCLPTPMATTQQNLPLALEIYDGQGHKVLRQALGVLSRNGLPAFDVQTLLHQQGCTLTSGYGHMELMYDFTQGREGDGWLHGLFRYRQLSNGHVADTSFGSHIFNTPITYKNQPLSYKGTPPGLSTRLFLRLAVAEKTVEAHFHLIYPVSNTWHAFSTTQLILMSQEGVCVAQESLQIPQSGSYYGKLTDMFDAFTLQKAGNNGYLIIRDETCRLFGYHGLIDAANHFSLDHMFGF